MQNMTLLIPFLLYWHDGKIENFRSGMLSKWHECFDPMKILPIWNWPLNRIVLWALVYDQLNYQFQLSNEFFRTLLKMEESAIYFLSSKTMYQLKNNFADWNSTST